MLSKKTLGIAWAAALVALLVPAPGSAQTPADQRTILTFSQPVTIPGHTLPAGTYEFQVADTSDRHVIQVFQNGGTKILATVFAIPSLRSDRPAKAEIRFLETPSTMPQAVQTWWYVGETTGHEFIYPREQAKLLAKTNPEGVLAGEGRTGEVTRVMPSGEEAPIASNDTTPKPATGKALQGDVPKMTAPKPVVSDDKTAPKSDDVKKADDQNVKPDGARDDLPRTASPLPWVLAAGVAFLGAAAASVASRRARRRQGI